jgi:hypothetical protein
MQTLWPESGDGSQAPSAIKEWPAYLGIPSSVWDELVRARAEIGQPVQVRLLGVDPEGDLLAWREVEESAEDPTAGDPGWMSDLARRGLDIWAEELAGVEGVEIRITNDRSLYSNAVFRFDDRMITYPYTKGQPNPRPTSRPSGPGRRGRAVRRLCRPRRSDVGYGRPLRTRLRSRRRLVAAAAHSGCPRSVRRAADHHWE